jgi:hypothetical protein
MRQTNNKKSQTANNVMDGKRTQVKHDNRYDPLLNELECYTCHNFGHKVAHCLLRNYEPDLNPSTKNFKVWKFKENDKCGLVLSAQRQKNPWYIDSGCSKHMIGDKGKFLSLSESKSRNVTFGNDASGKIKGKGMVSLSNGKGKS